MGGEGGGRRVESRVPHRVQSQSRSLLDRPNLETRLDSCPKVRRPFCDPVDGEITVSIRIRSY